MRGSWQQAGREVLGMDRGVAGRGAYGGASANFGVAIAPPNFPSAALLTTFYLEPQHPGADSEGMQWHG